MKKSFLIAGLLASIGATNGYAVQSGTLQVECICPAGCMCHHNTYPNGEQHFYCGCWPEQDPAPSPTFNIIHMVANQDNGAIQQSRIKSVKQKNSNRVSARSAEMPKVTKKIVYEEIVSDDEE